MPLMDEFKKERESVQHGSLSQKIAYFWDYHKWHILLVFIIAVFIANLIYNSVTRLDTILNGILLNFSMEDSAATSDDLVNGFFAEQKIDAKAYDAYLDTSLYYIAAAPSEINASNYQTMQAILTRSATGDLDFITAEPTVLIDLAYKDIFWNLEDILSEEQLALYEPYFCYIDMAVVEELDEANARNEKVAYTEYPDYAKPEAMMEPVPVLIDLSRSEMLSAAYNNAYDTLAIGIVNNTNLENTLLFIDYLLH